MSILRVVDRAVVARCMSMARCCRSSHAVAVRGFFRVVAGGRQQRGELPWGGLGGPSPSLGGGTRALLVLFMLVLFMLALHWLAARAVVTLQSV